MGHRTAPTDLVRHEFSPRVMSWRGKVHAKQIATRSHNNQMAGQSSYLPLSFCLSWSKFGYALARVHRGKNALAAAPALISRGWQLWDGTLTLLRPSRQPGSRPGVCGCLALLFCPSFYALHIPPPPTTSPCRSKSLIFASAACGRQ